MRQRKSNAKRGGQGGGSSGAAATGKPGDLLFGMAVSALVLLAVLGVVTGMRRPAASGGAGARRLKGYSAPAGASPSGWSAPWGGLVDGRSGPQLDGEGVDRQPVRLLVGPAG